MSGRTLERSEMTRTLLRPRKPTLASRAATWPLRAAYGVGFSIFSAFYLPRFFASGRHREGFSERLGRVPEPVRARLRGRSPIWLHGVSVGEVALAARLSQTVHELAPERKVLWTTTTPAGREVAERLKSEDEELLYFPVDFSFATRSFLRSTRPSVAALMETEIWPNLLFELERAGVPAVILNGRISDRAFGRYRAVRALMAPLFRRISAIGARDEAMRERFIAIGAAPDRVRVTGNMKFDWRPDDRVDAWIDRAEKKLGEWTPFLAIAGSTHAGEEEKLFTAARTLKDSGSDVRFLIAPRHLDRMESIFAAAAAAGLSAAKLSDWVERGGRHGDQDRVDVLVLDRFGVLARLYRAAGAVFVGGSLVPRGGHNLVEPAYFEKPVLFGPHMDNFREMASEFLDARAGWRVRDEADLADRLRELRASDETRRGLGFAAKALVARHQGATERNARLLLQAAGARSEDK